MPVVINFCVFICVCVCVRVAMYLSAGSTGVLPGNKKKFNVTENTQTCSLSTHSMGSS